jgi:acyl carrier protein
MGREQLKQIVFSVWSEFLDCKALGPDSDFFELGGDSIAALNMLFALGSELGVELPPGALFENSTFGGFTTFVYEAMASARSR